MKQIFIKVCFAIMIGVLILLSFMVIGNAWFTIYQADDFWHAVTIGAFNVGFFDYIKASFNFAIHMYKTWQGTYFSMFLQAFLSPLNNFGLNQMRFVMVLNAVLYIFGFLFMVFGFLEYYIPNAGKIVKLAILTCSFSQVLFVWEYPEIFSWFSGATCYSFPLSFLFISIALSLKAEKSKKKGCLIGAIICGFCGMGGVLGITGMGCCFMLIICLIPLIYEKKIKKYLTIVFGCDMVFALFATVAPGNFLRRSEVDAAFNPIKAVFLSAKKYWYSVEMLFKDTCFIYFWILFIIVGIFLYKKGLLTISYRYLISSILLMAVPFATIFPIILGYGGYDYFPNRCYYLLFVSLSLVLLNISVFLGCLTGKILGNEETQKTVMVLLVLFTFISVMGNEKRLEDNVAVIQINNLLNGHVKTFYNECNAFLYQVEHNEDEEVVLNAINDRVPCFADFYISEDTEYWINQYIADIYGKKSVRVIR